MKTLAATSLALALLTPGFAENADPQSPGLRALIVDERLREREVILLAIEPDSLLLSDERGDEYRRDIRGIIAVLPAPSGKDNAVPASGSGVLELTDGQRFPGTLLPTSPDGDEVRWVHDAIGEIAFSLEVILGARLSADRGASFSARQAASRINDELHLANGDLLKGFLAGLGDPIMFETDGQITAIPAGRVSALTLANDRDAPEGVYLWLGDGTIVRTDELATDPSRERLEFTLKGGQRAVYRVSALRGIAFDSARLLPLATLSPTHQAPTGNRLHADPIRYTASSYDDQDLGRSTLGLANIEFPGPMEVTYALPENSMRIGGTFTLDESSLPWGDCIVTIELDGRELFTKRLFAENLNANFSLTAEGDELTIRIDPGEHGPILDRVTLKRAIVLLRNEPQNKSPR